ncbi:MAG TPA: transporter [Candidatus Eisenbacteria bacterium]|nr:transporter [Candidatus Eisenbacteria bacterium]
MLAQTPIAGHYPPGQSGIRGAATPRVGWSVTNFNRFFSNLEAKGPDGSTTGTVDEVRYANITMVTVVTNYRVLGLHYGVLAGFPFATGNLNPSADELASKGFGPGDILVTPVSLYGKQGPWDYQFQFTLWSSSGRFSPGGKDNRGAGYESLVYSVGGAWYPGRDRQDWSVSAVARFGQNFEQSETGITPGDDVVIDWGVGKGLGRAEVGASGFATYQLSHQSGGTPLPDNSLYRYYGIGPEARYRPWEHWTFTARAHFEFETRNAVQGNNLWLIANYAH